MRYFSWFVIRLITPEVSNYLIINSSQNSAQRVSYQSKEKAVAFQLSDPIFLIAWFVSELCPLYWLQTNDLPSVLFFPFVAFAVSNREKAKMNQDLIFRFKLAVLKRLLSSKLQYSVMFLEPEYLYSTMLSLFFFSLVLTRIKDKKIFQSRY